MLVAFGIGLAATGLRGMELHGSSPDAIGAIWVCRLGVAWIAVTLVGFPIVAAKQRIEANSEERQALRSV